MGNQTGLGRRGNVLRNNNTISCSQRHMTSAIVHHAKKALISKDTLRLFPIVCVILLYSYLLSAYVHWMRNEWGPALRLATQVKYCSFGITYFYSVRKWSSLCQTKLFSANQSVGQDGLVSTRFLFSGVRRWGIHNMFSSANTSFP